MLDFANAIRPMAMLKEETGSVEEARQLWEEARDLYSAADAKVGVAGCSERLAQIGRAADL